LVYEAPMPVTYTRRGHHRRAQRRGVMESGTNYCGEGTAHFPAVHR